MSFDSGIRVFQTASSSNGYITSREMLMNYIRNMSNADLKKLLAPVREGILTENTILHMNTINFSVDHVVVPITVKDMLNELDPMWKKWIHSANLNEDGIPQFDTHQIPDRHLDQAIADYQVLDYIKDMNKHQKRSLLNLVREGVLTDECFIQVSTDSGPERVQIPMPRVIDTLTEAEKKFIESLQTRPLFLRIAYARHYSSASFERLHKADLDVRSLSAARFTMPIWYTVLWFMMTMCTCASQVWSQVTNYEGLQTTLNLVFPTIILVVSSIASAVLLYLTIYMVGFLICCENNLANHGLLTRDLNYGTLYRHFCELNRIEARIYTTKGIQFGLVWYSIVLTIYAHEHSLNLYPALITILTNGFGLMLFARIAIFFRMCRRTRHGTAVAAR